MLRNDAQRSGETNELCVELVSKVQALEEAQETTARLRTWRVQLINRELIVATYHILGYDNRVAQTAFILFSTFLDLRPGSDASD
jgi:hypothetical protein